MKHSEPQDFKLRPDGSIDLPYYMKIGREMRSEQAHKLFKLALPKGKFFAMPRWLFRASHRAGGATFISLLSGYLNPKAPSPRK